jgi:hypothetical protein
MVAARRVAPVPHWLMAEIGLSHGISASRRHGSGAMPQKSAARP